MMDDEAQLVPASPVWLRHGYIVPVLVLAILAGVQWGQFGIFGSDEPRIAGIANGMICSGDWVVPQLNGAQFLEKPPLFFWGLAGLYRTIGKNADVSRLISVIAAAGAVLMVWAFARVVGLSYPLALLAAFATATCERFAGDAWKCTMDMLLCFFVTGAILSFYLADRYRRRFALLAVVFALMFSGAIMTKSLVGIALPGIGMTVWLLWKRRFDWRMWGLLSFGTAIALAVFCLWLYAVYRRAGMDAVRTVVWTNNFQRFLGTQPEQAHMKPFYYYLPALFSELFPWCLLIPHAVWQLVRRFRAGKVTGGTIYLLCVTVAPLLLLTLSSSKRSTYLLPLAPVLSLLIVAAVADYLKAPRWEQKTPGPLWWIQCGCVVVAVAIPIYCFAKGLPVAAPLAVLALSLAAFVLLRRWTIEDATTRHVIRSAIAVGLVGLAVTVGVLLPRTRARDYESLFSVFRSWQQRQAVPVSLSLFYPQERLLGAAVFCLDKTVPAFSDETKLIDFLAQKNSVVITDHRNLSSALLDDLDIVLEAKTDRKLYVFGRSSVQHQKEARTFDEEE